MLEARHGRTKSDDDETRKQKTKRFNKFERDYQLIHQFSGGI